MKITGAIIAGGHSKRMGKHKPDIVFRGETLLNQAVKLLENFTETILISYNNTSKNNLYLTDEIKNIGPMGGIYTVLKNAKTDKVLVLPVDMPLLNEQVLAYLINNCKNDALINVFYTKNRTQMLVGIYDKALLPIMEQCIEKKSYKLRNLLDFCNTNLIDGQAFEDLFINVNTPTDLKRIATYYEH